MRDKFREFYPADEDEINDFWSNAYFSFDANVLLNLYRYSEQTRNDFLDILEFLSNEKRLWIPYQAAYEYQKNRLYVIDTQKNAYEKLKVDLKKKLDEINTELNTHKRHPYLNINDIKEKVASSINEIMAHLDQLKDEHPDFFIEDPVFDKLTALLDGVIGDELSEEEKKATYKEGKDRYEKKIPPGYMDLADKEKKGDQSLYGDLLIWKELLKRFSGNDDKIIFVTDDLKEDWWQIFKGTTISVRPELLKEFRTQTSKDILIYKPEQFLKYAESNLKQTLDEKTLGEVEIIRKADQDLVYNIDGLSKSPYDFLYPSWLKNGTVSSAFAGINDQLITLPNNFLSPNLLGNLVYGPIATGSYPYHFGINPNLIYSTPPISSIIDVSPSVSIPTVKEANSNQANEVKEKS